MDMRKGPMKYAEGDVVESGYQENSRIKGGGGDSRLEGAFIGPPLDPRGGVDRFPDDIDARRETPVAKSSRSFAIFDKEKKKKKKKKKKMNAGGKVRGAGKAVKGVRPAKMVKMKGS